MIASNNYFDDKRKSLLPNQTSYHFSLVEWVGSYNNVLYCNLLGFNFIKAISFSNIS